MGEPYDIDVLVVGTGPMGATTALALATYGISVQAISKWNWLANTPRAHITNQRSVEILREFGLEEEARKHATPWDQMGDSLFTTSLAGPEVARLRAWGTGDERFGDYLRGSPCANLDIPQPFMEPVLVNAAALRGARVSFNVEYLGSAQDDEGVTARLRDLITGAEFTRRARYLVGADGANSQIVKELGLPLVGTMARAGTIYAHFKADLARYVAHRPSILHWILNPAGGFGEIGMGLLRAVRPWGEWIAGWGFDISKGSPDLSRESALAKIRSLVGDPALDCELIAVSPWYVNQAYASYYSVGRIFCGGDAVHRHPPSSGLGSNTSMQDGFNLAWKLAMVVRGDAGPALLDTYSQERAPVGQQVVARANQSRVDYGPLRACFATTGEDDPVAAGLAKIKAPTAEGAAVRAALREALELKNYEFNAHGTELNQRYVSAAVIPEEGAGNEVWRRDPGLYLQATTRPGAKLPHAWLVGRDGIRVSTLDLVGRGRFTLMTGLSGQAWRAAADMVDCDWLRLVVVGEDDALDPYAVWHDASEIEEAGALLVRPDGYVAWRVRSSVWDAAEAGHLLRSAIERITCRTRIPG